MSLDLASAAAAPTPRATQTMPVAVDGLPAVDLTEPGQAVQHFVRRAT